MKKPVLYRLEEGQINQLREISQRTDTPEAAIVRQALDTYLPFLAATGSLSEVLVEATKTYDDAQDNPARIHRLASGWLHDREANSKRGALKRLEERMTALEQAVQEIREMIKNGR